MPAGIAVCVNTQAISQYHHIDFKKQYEKYKLRDKQNIKTVTFQIHLQKAVLI